MDHHISHPLLNFAIGELAEFAPQSDATEPQLYYHGMSVQTTESLCSVRFSKSNADHEDAHSIHPLNQFRVALPKQGVSDDFDETDFSVTAKLVHDQYVPWNPDDEPLYDKLLSTESRYTSDQSSYSEGEPDAREPIAVSRLHPDHHSTNLPADHTDPQDSRSVAVVNPPDLQQSASDHPANSAEIIDDKSSRRARYREWRRRRRQDPAYIERESKRRKDPAFVERERLRRKKYRENPAYAERDKESLKKRRQNPAYVERVNERHRERERERRKNPTVAERERAKNRERRKLPARAEREKERKRQYYKDPRIKEREKERRRLYCKDPKYAERRNERYRSDPVYAGGQRTYINVYRKMVKKFGKEEAAKLASVAKKLYLQSANPPEGSDNSPQTSNSAEATQNSDDNLEALLHHPSKTD